MKNKYQWIFKFSTQKEIDIFENLGNLIQTVHV